jgi:Mg-chelatase subunit ChlD
MVLLVAEPDIPAAAPRFVVMLLEQTPSEPKPAVRPPPADLERSAAETAHPEPSEPSDPKPAVFAGSAFGSDAPVLALRPATGALGEPRIVRRGIGAGQASAPHVAGVRPVVGQQGLSLSRPPSRPEGLPPGGLARPLELTPSGLDSRSPDAANAASFFPARRGLGAENAGGGGYATNGSSGAGTPNGAYRSLMRRIAEGITESTTNRELDIVFIVDTTESMVDNVRGVQAYVDEFVNTLTRDGRKPRFALVTFSDAHAERPKVRGFTDEPREFRQWFHQARFAGGGDIAESGLDAVVAALERLKFRNRAHRRFVFLSDAPFHDRDYDTQSDYTLDETIALLRSRNVVLDAVGLDFLPVKQLAWGTQGRWSAIPGNGYLEQIALPLPVRANAALGVVSVSDEDFQDEVLVFLRPPGTPQWVELRWRVLGPRGNRVAGEFSERREIAPGEDRLVFHPALDARWLRAAGGHYTAIYRLTSSDGRTSVLRRVIESR